MPVTHRTALLLLSLCAGLSGISPVYAGSGGLMLFEGGTLAVKQMQTNGSLLATLPASTFSRTTLSGETLQVAITQASWDENRGIYQSGIPGIGFSFCTEDGGECLLNGKSFSGDILSQRMRNFAIRLYKTGDVTAGDYTLPALLTLSHQGTLLVTVGLSALRVNVSQCSVTRDNLRVRFPDATLGNRTLLSAVNFHLPVVCKNAADYDNIAIHFSFSGARHDAQHIETGLPGIALSVKNEAGRYVDFSAAASDPHVLFHETSYVAELTRNAREKAQAGEFNVSITAEVEMR